MQRILNTFGPQKHDILVKISRINLYNKLLEGYLVKRKKLEDQLSKKSFEEDIFLQH